MYNKHIEAINQKGKDMEISIGTEFVRYSSKHKRLEVVTDILTTTNSKGEVVKVQYKVAHTFMGQEVTDLVPKTTILRSLDASK